MNKKSSLTKEISSISKEESPIKESKLKSLIKKLYKALKNSDPEISVVREPKLLITSLIELNSLIGNSEVKDKTAAQVNYLITAKNREIKTGKKDNDTMLNTILQGPPGVGKTLIGKKLAKIWYALGYLDGSNNPKNKSMMGKVFQENEMGTEDYTMYLLIAYIVILVISMMVSFMGVFWGYASSFYNAIGFKWFMIIMMAFVFFVAFSILIFFLYYRGSSSDSDFESHGGSGGKEKREIEIIDGEKVYSPSEDNLIEILGREDLVEQYVGWSAKKTKKVLTKNLGKVVFIDEAYAIVNGPHDEFGFEVLNTLNKFLSEHPGEIIVILGGYKEKLQNNLFSFQPGLARRFMWHFDCPGYAPGELFEIFKFQIEKKDFKLNEESRIRELIISNSDAFPNFGGDTERLAFLCKMEHATDYVGNSKETGINIINLDQVNRAIFTLRKNNLKSGQIQENDPMMAMMRMFNSTNENSQYK